VRICLPAPGFKSITFYRNAAIDAQDVVKREVASALLSHPGYKVVVTGHSLGGAVAALTATLLRNAGQVTDLVSQLLYSLYFTNHI
jgi:thioesterase domain-containing protein